MEEKWWLDVQIPIGGHSLAESDFDFLLKLMDFMEKAFPRVSDAGTGFGYRDIHYLLENEQEGEFLEARIRRALAAEYGEDLVKLCKFETRRY